MLFGRYFLDKIGMYVCMYVCMYVRGLSEKFVEPMIKASNEPDFDIHCYIS